MKSTTAFRIAAAAGFLAVALGAFGAHSIQKLLNDNNATETWKTASEYHLIHSAVLLFLATLRPLPKAAWIFFLCGIVLFSGSLYLYAVTKIFWLVFVTPIGGLSLLAGWLALLFKPALARD
ncbi:MAG TPA: DUF423 domain-containing protein [Chthoniobacteraceae bacterium]|nr:DUF423 domain-containing protein [Chthoniobacteraceae bacterium]